MIKIAAAVLLILLGGYMIFLGQQAGIRAPVVTGLGFFVIAAVFLAEGLGLAEGRGAGQSGEGGG